MRLKLLVAYEGGNFRGWQSQAGGGAVQDYIEAAFEKICGARVRIHGAGRTDAGVHALGQCAHVDLEMTKREMDWAAALNANLPGAIRVLRCARARGDFHARYSAAGKVYRYRIWNGPIFSPFELGWAWHLPMPLDIEAMRVAAKSFEGTHDFAAFAANRGKPEHDTVRAIYKLAVSKKGELVTLEYRGNGFLYKMVRLMTGALVKVGQGRAPVDSIREYLEGKSGKCAFAAPAEGLYLVRVIY
jgi:tRNA pseudouridine38-40 synthase